MLQQTQVSRVLVKYGEFLKKFPNFKSLARADLRDVLLAWSPLGYNRRAKYLLETARVVVESYQGFLPDDPLILETLPGLGKATARSVVAFTWDKPVIFIETNIRRVFIHHFFANKNNIKDKDILHFIEATLPGRNIRNWYYALMDYGAYLGTQGNANKKSAHYRTQSKFQGSNREVRGLLLKTLSSGNSFEARALLRRMPFSEVRVNEAIKDLKKEGIVGQLNGRIFIA